MNHLSDSVITRTTTLREIFADQLRHVYTTYSALPFIAHFVSEIANSLTTSSFLSLAKATNTKADKKRKNTDGTTHHSINKKELKTFSILSYKERAVVGLLTE